MVYAEATTVVPLIASYAYHKGDWKNRTSYRWVKIFQK
jgi:deoxyhypusine synthase